MGQRVLVLLQVYINVILAREINSSFYPPEKNSTQLAPVNEQKQIIRITQSGLLSEIVTYMDTTLMTSFNYSVTCPRRDALYILALESPNHKVLSISEPSEIQIACFHGIPYANSTVLEKTSGLVNGKNMTSLTMAGQVDIKLQSGVIGIGVIEFNLREYKTRTDTYTLNNVTQNHTPETEMTLTYDVRVLRKMRPVDTIFRVVIYCVQVLVMVGFGVKLDLAVVKENLKKPIAPSIGFFCQYIVMPLIAYGVAKVVAGGTTPVSLGIFMAGCCPGGGGSNMYSYLLNGDLSLSITMSTISTVAALGMLPLWVYTLGSTILEDDVQIPFQNIAISLSVIIIPLVVGVLIRMKCPKAALKIGKILKPVTIVVVLLLLVVGIYSNLFIFRLFKPRTVLAGCLLPYVGYIAGGIIAFILRQSWTKVKTIALETGMQNTSIAYILLTTSFMPPLGDIAAIAPVASAVMTPLPPFIATVVYLLYNKFKNKYSEVNTEAKGGDDLSYHEGENEDNVALEKLTAM